MAAYYKYDTAKTDRILAELNEEYPAITIPERIHGTVTKILESYPNAIRNNPHHACVTIADSFKKRILARNLVSIRLSLDDVLRKGDLIHKNAGSDSLTIYKLKGRDTLVYYFSLNDDLNYPLKARGN
jgi:hypothetical protein